MEEDRISMASLIRNGNLIGSTVYIDRQVMEAPVGFVYTQYPLQLSPWELWNDIPSNWEDISYLYEGLFPVVNSNKFNKEVTFMSMSNDNLIINRNLSYTINNICKRGATLINKATGNIYKVQHVARNNDTNTTITANRHFAQEDGLTFYIFDGETLPNISGKSSVHYYYSGSGGLNNQNAGAFFYGNKPDYTTYGSYGGGTGNNQDYGINFSASKGQTNASASSVLNESDSTYIDGAKVQPDNFAVKVWKKVN